MTWLTLSDIQVSGHLLRLRFQPDRFVHDGANPVTEVSIEGVDELAEATEILARFRDDYIVSLLVEPTEIRVLGEMDDDETIIRGTTVTSRAVAYSAAELEKIAVFFEHALRGETSEAYRKEAKLKDIRHFVSDLIERADRKRSMSERDSIGTESQLAVLQRVLNRLGDP